MQTLTIIRPDDWHVHLRDGIFLQTTVPATASRFARAIVMPNLVSPVVNLQLAQEYFERIKQHIPSGTAFTPLMTLYLTDNTTSQTIAQAAEHSLIKACKLYPAGATTNSQSGVTRIEKIYPALETMQKYGIPLLVHGEVTDPAVDIFDREKIFIETVLIPLRQQFPALRIVLEHITTSEAVDYILSAPSPTAATLTIHHLLLNRNDLFAGGIKPHYYCLPVLKRNTHQQALLKATTSGNPRFFLGTDSAPHALAAKETCSGCAGIFSALSAIELYAEVFEKENALDKLEAFASFYGADFYGLPRNTETLTLKKENWTIPEKISYGSECLVPLYAGKTLSWKSIL